MTMTATTNMRYGVIMATLAVLQLKCLGIEMNLLRVECEVEHRYAVTHVTAAVTNKRNTSQEIPLRLSLPPNAYVSSLVMEIGGRNFSTVVTEKERHRRKGLIPDRKDPNSNSDSRKRKEETQKFRATAKATGLQTVTFYLTYEELLQRTRGRYTHTLYLGAAKKLAAVEVSVRIVETENIQDFQILKLPWLTFLSREGKDSQVEQEVQRPGEVIVSFRRENVTAIPKSNRTSNAGDDSDDDDAEGNDGIFSVSYDIDRQADGGEIQVLGRFFVHYFSPEGLPKIPTHTVFVLDVSGSMHDNGKLQQLKMAMRAILTDLQSEDSFEVLVFSTRVTSLGVYQAVPDEIERSVSKIQRLQALGGTNFNDALLKALQDVNAFNLTTGAKQVVFLTDGRPNLGEKKPNQLRRNIREANIHHHPIFSLGFGQDADMRLLKQVSSDNRGFTRKIDEDVRPADQLKGFYEEISSPLMTDVNVMYLEDEVDPNSVVRQGPSTFYAGDEMVLAGQLRDGVTEVQPIVTGHGRTGPVQFRVSRISTPETPPERDNYVERLWAYLTVQDLLHMKDVVVDRNLRAEMNARALEIALRFHFVTELTSLDLEEPDTQQNGEDEDYKSASRHQKSNTGHIKLLKEELTLLSAAEFAKTLPAKLGTRLNAANNKQLSFGDNDPHFVVQVSGMEMPLCFDIHGQHGQVLNLVRDSNSGIIVNGHVTSAVGRPEATYFTQLFIGLGRVNFTITPHNITISSLEGHRNSKVARVLRSVWPFRKMYRRGSGWSGKTKRRSGNKRSNNRDRRDTINDQFPSRSRQGRNHDQNYYGNNDGGQRFPKPVLIRGSNYVNYQTSIHSLTDDQTQPYVTNPEMFTYKVNSVFQNNLSNLGRKHFWKYDHKGTEKQRFIGSSGRAGPPTRGGPYYDYLKSQYGTRDRSMPQTYKKDSPLLLQTENGDFGTDTPASFRKQNKVISTMGSRTSTAVPILDLEWNGRQLRRSKIKKQGKTRYKRNSLLMKVEDIHHLGNHGDERGNTGRRRSHTGKRNVHPHLSNGHRYDRREPHPQSVGHRARGNTHNDHTGLWLNPLSTIRYSQTSINRYGAITNDQYSEMSTTSENPALGRITESLRSQIKRDPARLSNGRIQSVTPANGNDEHSNRNTFSETAQESSILSDTGKSTPPLPPANERIIHPHINRNHENLHHSHRDNLSTTTRRDSLDASESQNHATRNDFHPHAHRHSQHRRHGHGSRSQVEHGTHRSSTIQSKYIPKYSQVKRGDINHHNVLYYYASSSNIKGELDERDQLRSSTEPLASPSETQKGDTPAHRSSSSSRSSTSEYVANNYHPHSMVFNQTQRGSLSARDSHTKVTKDTAGENLAAKQDNVHHQHVQERIDADQMIREPSSVDGRESPYRRPGNKQESRRRKQTKTFTWRRAAGRRYGNVVVALRNRKKLDLLMGDVEAHFVITRSKTKFGQEFLGFYVEEHHILSPNTTGIIGQFAFKTVGTMASAPLPGNRGNNFEMKLAVLQPEASRQYRVSEVNGMVSKRRSMLHNSHVRCLLIPNQGRGLVAGTPKDYVLPCLTC